MNLLNEIKQVLSEATAVNFQGQKYILKVDVNEDPNKKGIKVQFLPTTYEGMSKQKQDEIAMALENKLDQGLATMGMKVERDRQLKDKTIIGFFIYIEYIDKIVRQALAQSNQQQKQ